MECFTEHLWYNIKEKIKGKDLYSPSQIQSIVVVLIVETHVEMVQARLLPTVTQGCPSARTGSFCEDLNQDKTMYYGCD